VDDVTLCGLYLIDIADSDCWEEDLWERDGGGVDCGHHSAAICRKHNINKIEKTTLFKSMNIWRISLFIPEFILSSA
jgi:hypothetical protein